MHKRGLLASSVALALVLGVAGCGDDGGDDTTTATDSGSDSGATSGDAITLGVLTTGTGAASAGFTEAKEGADARIAAYQAQAGSCTNEITTVLGDDASSPQGALAAAQKLVEQEDVYAVMPMSPFFYGAGQYAGTQAADTPFLGAGFDGGPQWLNEDFGNLFNAIGSVDYAGVSSTYGEYFKAIGGTKIAVVTADTPSSSGAGLSAVQSAEAAGLERGYVNTKIPLGSTDVGAAVLGIKESGADVVYLPLTPDTAFAIAAGLAQAGVTPKRVLLATGYGSDLLKSEPAKQAAQGLGFVTTSTAPIDAQTEGTKALADAVKKSNPDEAQINPEGLPSFSFGVGWLTTDLFLHGLDLAGCDASQEEYIQALRGDDTWDADGLAPGSTDFSKYGDVAAANGPGNCFYVSILEGDDFNTDPAANPICGDMLDEKVKQ